MTDTPERLLRLLSLLQTAREWPGSELADRLGVSARTVRRDVERLRGLGYPVEATMGQAGGYRLVAGTAMPPLLLDDDEAVAIAVGLRTAAGQAVAGMDEASVRALAKVLQVLPHRLRHQVGALGDVTSTLATGGGADIDPDVLTTVAAAISGRQRLRFDYRTANGTGTARRAEPRGLVAAGRRWYLVAFDVDRDDWRTFRVDRMAGVQQAGGQQARPELPAADPADYVAGSRYEMAPTYRAVVTLHAPVSEVMRQVGEGAGDLVPVNERTCRWRTHRDTLEWLTLHLTRLSCSFEVHEPPELVDHLRSLADRLDRAVAAPAAPGTER